MLKNFALILTISVCAAGAAFVFFFIGMSHAPQQLPSDEMDHVQGICDLSRKEPWKPEIKTSCEYIQDYMAIDYKCEDVRGCFTTRRLDGEIRY